MTLTNAPKDSELRPAGRGAADPAAQEAPRQCPCHHHPMRWHPDRSRPGGGKWRCRIKWAAEQARYNRSDKGRERYRRDNGTPAAQTRKALYQLTRIRAT